MYYLLYILYTMLYIVYKTYFVVTDIERCSLHTIIETNFYKTWDHSIVFSSQMLLADPLLYNSHTINLKHYINPNVTSL